MADSRPSPDHREREQLRQFVRVVDAMNRRRFIERYRTQDHTILCVGGIKAPDYDREDFDAFLTDFRKVALSDGEPIYLTKVLRTVGKYASDQLREDLKLMRAEIILLLEGKGPAMNIGYENGGQETSLSPERVLNALVNGDVFHVDPGLTTTAGQIRGFPTWFYLWPALHYFVAPILHGCIWLFHAIRYDGILRDEDYPARCRAPVPDMENE